MTSEIWETSLNFEFMYNSNLPKIRTSQKIECFKLFPPFKMQKNGVCISLTAIKHQISINFRPIHNLSIFSIFKQQITKLTLIWTIPLKMAMKQPVLPRPALQCTTMGSALCWWHSNTSCASVTTWLHDLGTWWSGQAVNQ